MPGSGWSDHDDAFAAGIEDHAAAVAHLLDSLGVNQVRLVEPNLDPGVGGISAVIAAYDEAEFVARGHAVIVAETLAEAALGG